MIKSKKFYKKSTDRYYYTFTHQDLSKTYIITNDKKTKRYTTTDKETALNILNDNSWWYF